MDINDLGRTLKYWGKQMAFGPDFSDVFTIELWFEELRSYAAEDVKNAFKIAFRTFDRFPSFKQVREILDGNTLTRGQQGDEIAGRIVRAMSKFGGYSTTRAETFIGPEGWEAVKRAGGWQTVCMGEDDQIPYLKRDLKVSLDSILARNGVMQTGHTALPPGNNPARKLIDAEVRKLTEEVNK